MFFDRSKLQCCPEAAPFAHFQSSWPFRNALMRHRWRTPTLSQVLFRPKTCEKISAVKKVMKYHAFSEVRSAKKPFAIIIGKWYTLRMPGILKISFCRLPIPGNGFIDWLHGYYLCSFMLRTCTDKMADPIHCLHQEVFFKY